MVCTIHVTMNTHDMSPNWPIAINNKYTHVFVIRLKLIWADSVSNVVCGGEFQIPVGEYSVVFLLCWCVCVPLCIYTSWNNLEHIFSRWIAWSSFIDWLRFECSCGVFNTLRALNGINRKEQKTKTTTTKIWIDQDFIFVYIKAKALKGVIGWTLSM